MKPSTLQRYFPAMGPCLICSDPTYRQNHRVIDAIRSRARAGESIASLARDYRVSRAAVSYVVTTPIKKLDFLRRARTEQGKATT